MNNKLLSKKQNTNIKAWFFLSFSFTFMICIFAPIEAYYTNKSEFWFSIWQLLLATGLTFVITLIIFILISCCLSRTKISIYCYVFFMFTFLYLYIQGNYIPRNYGVLNGVDIPWDQYKIYGIASIVVALLCFLTFLFILLKFKAHIFKIGSYICLFILGIQLFTIATLMVQNIMDSSSNTYDSRIVTNNKMLNYSNEHNIIVFILDAYDGDYFNYLLKFFELSISSKSQRMI